MCSVRISAMSVRSLRPTDGGETRGPICQPWLEREGVLPRRDRHRRPNLGSWAELYGQVSLLAIIVVEFPPQHGFEAVIRAERDVEEWKTATHLFRCFRRNRDAASDVYLVCCGRPH